MRTKIFQLAFIVIALLCGNKTIAQRINPNFTDVSAAVGLSQIKANKYWSPVIADLDRDGYYDLILCNHGGTELDGVQFISPEMYWGTSTGFVPFERRSNNDVSIPLGGTDYHGFSVGYFGNKDDNPDLILTVGGSNGGRGNLPITAEFVGGRNDYIVRKDLDRKDAFVSPELLALGIDGFGRGRSSFFIDMDQDGDLDLVYNCNGPADGDLGENITDSKFMYEWKDGKFNRIEDIGALKDNTLELSAMADINHDSRIDLLYYAGSENMQCWINQGDGFDFKLDNSYLPKGYNRVSAVAEIDYDADGDFDLYLARSAYNKAEDDVLLEWDEIENKYIDVTNSANIPKDGMHKGVSVGDFDNNGFSDVFIGVYSKDDVRLSDIILMNNGDKTFKAITDHGATIISDGEDGDQAEVFDYNKDGKLDILSASKYGLWRLFRNNTDCPENNFISVQVGRSSGSEKFVPLGAAVTVTAKKLDKTHKVMRRIGSQGQSHSQSFIDMMHFGLGEFDLISEISVDYGTHRETTKFEAGDGIVGKTYTIGKFATNGDNSSSPIQGSSKNAIKIFPNPTNGKITLQSNKSIDLVTIVNLSGHVLKQFSPEQNSINISNLMPGIYFIYSEINKKTFINKIILE